MKNLAIYVHWPFCLSKCPYCDFNSRVLPEGEDEKKWVVNFERELSFYAQELQGREITSLYFGGGTPSLMHSTTVEAVINKVAALWPVANSCEMTIEANPTSSETEKFKAFRAAGINRISLGVQSLDDAALHFLGRTHNAVTACRAIEMAATIFDRFSFDLIYARAGQTPEMWEKELTEALSFSSRHLSLYQLTLEQGSVFYKRPDKNKLIASEDLSVEMFEMTQEIMAQAGLPAYEISNHARQGQESRHNLTYWHYDDYIGIGAGAHGRFINLSGQRCATENHKQPNLWLEQCESQGQGVVKMENINLQASMQEAFMMGLRLTGGLDKKDWQKKFSQSLEQFLEQDRLCVLEKEGLIKQTSQIFRTTDEGRKKLNAILAFLL